MTTRSKKSDNPDVHRSVTDSDEAAPPIGHNHPPIGAAPAPAEIDQYLTVTLDGLIKRRQELIEGISEFLGAHPTIDDDDVLGAAMENDRMAQALLKATEARFTEQKKPWRDAASAVDGWFNTKIRNPMAQSRKPLQAAMDAYARRKLAKERAEAEERRKAAEKAAEEAAKRALAAKPAKSPFAWDDAEQAAIMAEKAARDANARAPDMTRSYGMYGAVGSVRTSWSWEVVDPALVPREFLKINEDAVKEAARDRDPDTNKPRRVIPGIAWVENAKMGVR